MNRIKRQYHIKMTIFILIFFICTVVTVMFMHTRIISAISASVGVLTFICGYCSFLEMKAKKQYILYAKNKKSDAIHEAGHAIVSAILFPNIAIREISIIPDIRTGSCYILYDKENADKTKEDILSRMAVFYAGMIAEEMILGKATTGAVEDLKSASKLAYDVVTKYGMHKTFLSQIGDRTVDAKLIEMRINDAEEVCKEAHEKAKNAVTRSKQFIEELAKVLEESFIMNEAEIRKFMTENEINEET